MTRRGRNRLAFLAVVVGLVAVCGWCLLRGTAEKLSVPSSDESTSGEVSGLIADAAGKPAARRVHRSIAAAEDLSEEDRQMCEALQEAMDEENFEKSRRLAVRAAASKNSEVRLLAVEALEWFGVKALPELTPMMSDPDEEIAESAVIAWESGLSEIEDPGERLKISAITLKVLSDPMALEMIGESFADSANELIDDEEDEQKAAVRRTEVIQTLVDLMGENEARTAAAKEIYESVTGYEWLGVDEAERYLADPDEYEPPEEEGGV